MADQPSPPSPALSVAEGLVTQVSDEAVIDRCLQGDLECFSILVDRYREAIYGFVRHLIGDPEEACDLAQEAFVRAYDALPRFRPGAKFSSWLYTIAANLCRSWLRKQKHRPLSLEELSPEGEPIGPEGSQLEVASPEEIHAQREFRRRVLQAVNQLPTKYRLVVILRHLNDLSYQEMAEVLNLPVTTVEHRLRTAREMLRGKLRRELEGWL
ncbi:MAG TPA: sigma-70 family RNA polymerase sigma factor [Armatimonadetes bacterium]|nr:sigma-70 family RNA polymerase sigma factor [Armatimonadota bacterium]